MHMFSLRVLRSSVFARRSLSTVADVHIPVIDFSRFLRAESYAEKKPTADAVVSAFKDSGFIYLEKHGIPDSTVKNAFAKSAEFFKQPFDVKSRLAWEDPRSNRGYVAIGRERVTQSDDPAEIAALRSQAPDMKETMEIGRDWDSEWKNMWPEENRVPEFKRTMLEFYQTCHDLHVRVMRSIAIGLELDEGFFDKYVDEQCHNLRLLSYPPIERAALEAEGQARAGAHSDYGTVTLLFQDSIGGLQVQHPHTKVFCPAPPIPGTIVVNVGDLLARWSNDVFRSTLHRVVAPSSQTLNSTENMAPARQSIAFFCNPNFGADIGCLPNCFGRGVERKYPTIKAGDYIVGRLSTLLWRETGPVQFLMLRFAFRPLRTVRAYTTAVRDAFLEPLAAHPGITCLSLNRPQSKNAISQKLLQELSDCLDDVNYDKTTRVLILRSTTMGSFCAGADLAERRTMTQIQVSKFLSSLRVALGKLEALPIPTIAAIDGPALGGGLELSLACDLRVAGYSVAKIGLPETSLGIIPGAGGTQRVTRLLGLSKAKDLIYTARTLNAQEAHEFGLVDYVSDPESNGFERALQLAQDIARNAPLALRAAKQAISRAEDLALEPGLDFERASYEVLLSSKDRIEALQAFREKRLPVFKGE